jgi:hypothetical protein
VVLSETGDGHGRQLELKFGDAVEGLGLEIAAVYEVDAPALGACVSAGDYIRWGYSAPPREYSVKAAGSNRELLL